MSEILTHEHTPGSHSNIFAWLVNGIEYHLYYIMHKEDLEHNLIQKIENFVLTWLSSIDFEDKIRSYRRMKAQPEIQVIIPFLADVFEEILENITLSEQEIFILKKISKKHSQDDWLDTYKKHIARVLAIQTFDVFNVIMLEDNFGLKQEKWMNLVHHDILYQNHNYWDDLRFTLSGKIKSKVLHNHVDPEILYQDIIETYRRRWDKIDNKKQTPQEKESWLQGILCIINYRFKPALHKLARPSFGWDKESLFYLGDYYQIWEHAPNTEKRKWTLNTMSESDKEFLESIEKIANKLLEYLQAIDYTEHQILIDNINTSLTVNNIFKFFQEIVKKQLSILQEDNFIGALKYQTEKSIYDSMEGVFSAGILDIFGTMMLNINFWIEKKTCKRIILENMKDGVKRKALGIEIVKASGIKNNFWNEEIIGYVQKHLNSYNWSSEGPRCPYLRSFQKKEFIDTMWTLLEKKLLPALQQIYAGKEVKKKNELFLLWKYNK